MMRGEIHIFMQGRFKDAKECRKVSHGFTLEIQVRVSYAISGSFIIIFHSGSRRHKTRRYGSRNHGKKML